MQEISTFWRIAPADPDDSFSIYGNVADITDWPNWELVKELFPVRLFIGKTDDPWDDAMLRLAEWQDFIWSDDEVPWVTQKGADLLLSSQLTGFQLRKILITGIGNISLEDVSPSELPSLYRLSVPSEVVISPGMWPRTDFFIAMDRGRRLAITEKALNWLDQVGWKNFQVQPLEISDT